MSNKSQKFDYNIKNYSLDEVKDIFGITDKDNLYVANEKMSEFFLSSKNNQPMLRFFRDAQRVIYRDPKYIKQLNTDNYDEDDEDDEDNKEISQNNMRLIDGNIKKYYPWQQLPKRLLQR